jgi:hypothetical protein
MTVAAIEDLRKRLQEADRGVREIEAEPEDCSAAE